MVEGGPRPYADDHLKPKPSGLDRHHAEQFGDTAVVSAYAARPPYPDRLLFLLAELASATAPSQKPSHAGVLDLGCGLGELSRRLAPAVATVTAIDQSAEMIAAARSLPGGDAPNITWTTGTVEDVTVSGSYSAALAADSFHWFDWPVVLRRIAGWVPSARLVLVDRRERETPWAGPLAALVAEHSTNRDFERFDLVDELQVRRYFVSEGRLTHRSQVVSQSVAGYVTSLHSRNGLSLDRLTPESARVFDDAVRAMTAPHAADGLLSVPIETRIVWGRATP